jgi:ABC-2 type transport system ATP-binding protein
MIEFDNVTRRYGTKTAVAALNLSIPRGELFALLGPNGAGKTTTIKMLVGLLRPSSGAVRLCGYDVVSESREANRLLGYIPDTPQLYEKLTGREFLQFIADMHAIDGEAALRQMVDQIAAFELSTFVDDLTETYSHGMKQRLAFAAAMLHEPAVLVIDEPLVGLDPRSVRLVKDLLRVKVAKGMTIFMSTHLLSVAEEIADRVGIFDQGKLRFLGTVNQLQKELSLHNSSLEHLYLSLTSTNDREIDAIRGMHAEEQRAEVIALPSKPNTTSSPVAEISSQPRAEDSASAEETSP